MADRFENFHIVSDPFATPETFTVDIIQIDQGVPVAFVLHIPAGHHGKTGVQLSYAGHQLIPTPPRVYYRGGKRTFRRELSGAYPTGGQFEVQHFNAGQYPHAFDLEIEVDALDLSTGLLPPVLLLYPDPFDGGGGGGALPAPGSGTGDGGGGGFVPV